MLRGTITNSLGVISVEKKTRPYICNVAVIDRCGTLVTRNFEVVRLLSQVQAMVLPLQCYFRPPRVASNRRAIHTP